MAHIWSYAAKPDDSTGLIRVQDEREAVPLDLQDLFAMMDQLRAADDFI